MAHWTLDDIAWKDFDRSKLNPGLLSIVKAASLVEYNARDYSRYLGEVFGDDAEFMAAADEWAREEVQHGQALGRWMEIADPQFNFEKSFQTFVDGYKLPVNVEASVRGSKSGELIARCIVEVGTSSYYTAIKEYTDEPVLKAICAKIAADELRHYKLFYTHLQRYLEKENIGLLKRLKVALGRITESEDDELAYAYYAAHHPNKEVPYDHKLFSSSYMANALSVYRKHHFERMVTMILKAVGLNPQGWYGPLATNFAWNNMVKRRNKVERYKADFSPMKSETMLAAA